MIGNCTYYCSYVHIQLTFNSLPLRCLDLELTPIEVYDVMKPKNRNSVAQLWSLLHIQTIFYIHKDEVCIRK